MACFCSSCCCCADASSFPSFAALDVVVVVVVAAMAVAERRRLCFAERFAAIASGKGRMPFGRCCSHTLTRNVMRSPPSSPLLPLLLPPPLPLLPLLTPAGAALLPLLPQLSPWSLGAEVMARSSMGAACSNRPSKLKCRPTAGKHRADRQSPRILSLL